MYTLGCEKLLVLVDHKPLIGLLTNRELGDIDNPRLIPLAERLLWWRFRIEHIAGAKNWGPDALSHAPGPVGQLGALGYVSHKDMEWSGTLESEVLAMAASRRQLVITWDAIRNAGIADSEYAALLYAVGHDVGDDVWDKELSTYKRFKDEFTAWTALYCSGAGWWCRRCCGLTSWQVFIGRTRV